MLCMLILSINSGTTYSLKSIPNNWFLRNIFIAILFYSQRNIFFITFYWRYLILSDLNRDRLMSNKSRHMHAYILNWPLYPFGQIYNLASHTTSVMYVNFIHMQRNHLQFKVDSEQLIFERLFHYNFLLMSEKYFFILLRFYLFKNL